MIKFMAPRPACDCGADEGIAKLTAAGA